MKLLTWNVQWFRGVDGVVDVARVIGHARALCDFDVLCLQEVSLNFPGLAGTPPVDQAAAVAALLPGFEVIFTPAVDYRLSSRGERAQFGNLVATRLPVVLVERHLLPLAHEEGVLSARRACTSVVVNAASGPVTVMTTHLEYYSVAQRCAQVDRLLAIHRENCDLAATDAGRPDSGLYQGRPRGARAVLCGDFNFSAGSSEHLSLMRGTGQEAFADTFSAVHGAAARPATFGVYDRTYLKEPISCDHVFATRNIAGLARRWEVDGVTQYSDHQPVFVEWEGL